MHGGATLVGTAHGNFKTGRYSKYLPERLAGRYAEAMADVKLLELKSEVALIDVRLGELLTHLDSGLSLQHWKDAQAAHSDVMAAIRAKNSAAMLTALGALGTALDAGMGDYLVWAEILDTTEARRKLVESEHKRLVAMQQMITAEQAMVLLAVITDTVRKHVSDPSTLSAISADLRAITLNQSG
jgi:hypothetical protein